MNRFKIQITTVWLIYVGPKVFILLSFPGPLPVASSVVAVAAVDRPAEAEIARGRASPYLAAFPRPFGLLLFFPLAGAAEIAAETRTSREEIAAGRPARPPAGRILGGTGSWEMSGAGIVAVVAGVGAGIGLVAGIVLVAGIGRRTEDRAEPAGRAQV
jgi:hypothetical protein